MVPSKFPREFTISVGPAGSPPADGEIWLLAGQPYLVAGVVGGGSTWHGKLHFLTEALPGDLSAGDI